MNILIANLLLSTVVFWVAARIYVLPRLQTSPVKSILTPILLLHSMRQLGLMFLAPGATYPRMPLAFAQPAAIGDLITAMLAFTALWALMNNSPSSRLLVWLFNIVGTLDLIMAIFLSTIHNAAPHLGAAYWIPAFWVPALLVTHYITFLVLQRRGPELDG